MAAQSLCSNRFNCCRAAASLTGVESPFPLPSKKVEQLAQQSLWAVPDVRLRRERRHVAIEHRATKGTRWRSQRVIAAQNHLRRKYCSRPSRSSSRRHVGQTLTESL